MGFIKREFKKRYVFIFLLLVIALLYGPSYLYGYHWTKSSEIKNSYPFKGGKIVFDKKLSGHELVILDTGTNKGVKLMDNPLGLLYRSSIYSQISGEPADRKMRATWSGRLRDDKSYDMVFAAQALSKDIVKVVVSNRHQENKDLTLSEVKEASSFYVEMDIHNGYAAHYTRLSADKIGGFVFRGINSEGKIVSIYY